MNSDKQFMRNLKIEIYVYSAMANTLCIVAIFGGTNGVIPLAGATYMMFMMLLTSYSYFRIKEINHFEYV